MEGNTGRFLHLFVFQCRRCGEPIAVPLRNDGDSLESVRSRAFSISCRCGWSEWLAGMDARNHWVEPWMEVEVAVAG
jgi:hypothetical protein